MDSFWFALWFFLPAGVANVTPIFASHLPFLKKLDAPVDAGKSIRDRRILGNHKTWRGIVSGVAVAVLITGLQLYLFENHAWAKDASQQINYSDIPVFTLGFLLGFGALFGDLAKSFFKRQFNVRPGKSWFPFDQLDYIVGGLAFSALLVSLSFAQYVWIVAVWFGIHLISSYIGFLLKLKDSPI